MDLRDPRFWLSSGRLRFPLGCFFFLPDLKPRHIRGFLSFPPPALGESGHCRLSCRLMRWRPALMVREDQRPHPRRSYWRRVRLEDAAHNGAAAEHVEIVITPMPRWAAGRRSLEEYIAKLTQLVLLHGPLLRARRERPRGHRTADESASSHYSITSSARASSVGGTSRPSAFAVLRLMISSNFVGCTTGRSAGLSPFRIRPA